MTIKQILILDTETTGLDPKRDRLVEVAVAIFSVEHRAIVRARSWLVEGQDNAAVAVNGIPAPLLHQGADPATVFHNVECIGLKECQAIVAHGAAFDRQWFPPEIRRMSWICSCDDIEWPRPSSSRSLTALALAHGVGVVAAHRALDDVLTLCRLFERAAELGGDLQAMLVRALRPKDRVVSLAPFEDRQLVKEHGFQWCQERREWWRTMPEEDTAHLPFAVRIEPAAEQATGAE
jgi:DNA polymerase III subunit epsilon